MSGMRVVGRGEIEGERENAMLQWKRAVALVDVKVSRGVTQTRHNKHADGIPESDTDTGLGGNEQKDRLQYNRENGV